MPLEVLRSSLGVTAVLRHLSPTRTRQIRLYEFAAVPEVGSHSILTGAASSYR